MPKKKESDNDNVNNKLDEQIAKLPFASMVDLAENLTDMSVECIPTGFPQLDKILHDSLLGLARGRDVEIYSKEPEVGKTSLALQILAEWQSRGLKTAIIDIERTITVDYLHQLGVATGSEDPNIYNVRIVRPPEALHAEAILDLVRGLSGIFDLVVVDTIGAMDIKANLEKDSDETAKIGAIAKLMSDFMKKNVSKQATVLWVNQTRQVVGGYNPTGNIRYSTMGGRALPFFASIRLELSIMDKIKDNNDDVVAYKVKIFTGKNKLSPQWKQATLTYVFGEGFSKIYDYFEAGLKSGAITKKGGWFEFAGQKIQGETNFYNTLKSNTELLETLKNTISGVDPLE